ncbi:hypothetical protein H257_07620 [Aphanomyces astaci]|uniref:Uncharacterized protein n=1 Tax=Aphanomyces astaci TaxID=112090 RepID=W4GGH8_APHAT|nr:hypothetical protein H257_07620 [Aphanomyces astaci]ETV78790.1 hypothetical protein H257_07620 [Aphanomyces astaci]|eukprot:XP_009831509.1 hypothetical protein H257_07620 [Aphanomyces astaci]
MLLTAQVKRWKDGIKVLINQPERQNSERGGLLENAVHVDDVLVPQLAYLYGSDAKSIVMTPSVKFNCVMLDTTCGPPRHGARKKHE